MEIYSQDESSELAQIRVKYGNDSNFLLSLKSSLHDAEYSAGTEPSVAIQK